MVKRLKAGPARFVHWHYVDGWRPKLWLAMTTETTRKRVGGLDKPEICFQSEINLFMFLNYFTPYIFSTVLQLQFSQSLDFCQSIHFFPVLPHFIQFDNCFHQWSGPACTTFLLHFSSTQTCVISVGFFLK